MFRELFILCIVSLFARESLSISLLFNNLQEFYPGFDANGTRYCKTYYNLSNDCFGGAAKLGSKVSEMRKELETTLLINEGSKFIDIAGIFQPKWWGYFWQYGDEEYRTNYVVRVTQIINYDLIILTQDDMGHLFDLNATKQTPTESFLKNISSNTQILTGCNVQIKIYDERYSRPYRVFQEKVKNSTVIEVYDSESDLFEKVGVLGYVLGELNGQHWVGGVGIEYDDYSECLSREIEYLKKQNVSLIVGIFSMLMTQTRNLLKNNKGIDVVILGSRWDNGDIEEYIGKTLVVRAQPYGKVLHKLEVIFDPDGTKYFKDNILPLDNSVPNEKQIIKYLNESEKTWNKLYSEDKILGVTKTSINGEFYACGKSECQLGNLIADALYENFPHHRNSSYQPDNLDFVAVVTANDIWSSINAQNESDYNMTMADIFYSFPVQSCAWVRQFSGSQLKNILENSVVDFDGDTSSIQFLQISGAKVEYDLNEPECQRVTKLSIKCWNCSEDIYIPINETKKYYIINHLGYYGKCGSAQKIQHKKILYRERDKTYEVKGAIVCYSWLMHDFIAYVNKSSPIDVKITGRIHIIPLSIPISHFSGKILLIVIPTIILVLVLASILLVVIRKRKLACNGK